MTFEQFAYDGPVHIERRQAWMDAVTNNKFEEWDHVVRNNLMETGTDLQKAQVFKMLQDPTIYMYAWFKNEDGTPFRTYSYQDIILNDPNKRVIFAASNQIGKSVCLCIKALTFALNHPGQTVLMVSKTLPQAKDLLRQIKRLLNNCALEYKYDIGDTDTKTDIYFRHFDILRNGAQQELNQSRIICVPATEAALGYAAHLVLIDELAFYEDGEYFYKQIVQPRTYTTKGQIIVFSNPNGDTGIFYELWQDKKFSKYRFNFLDRPGNYEEELFSLMEGLSQAEIDSTLLAEFSSSKGAFLTVEERKAIQEDRPNTLPLLPSKQFYVFFDWAKVQDRTVRAIASNGDTQGSIFVHELLEYKDRTPYSSIVDDLQRLITEYGPERFAVIGWDNTGVGAGIEDFIKKIELLGIPCLPVKFSLENKSRMYTVFKTLAERTLRAKQTGTGQFMLSIPYNRDFDRQLAMLRFERSGGNLRVHHEKESDRDDIPDAIAGLCGLMVHPDYYPSDASISTPIDESKCSCGAVRDDERKDCANCGEIYPEYNGVV